MIRVLIADDHPIVRDGLKYVLAGCADVQIVGEAEDARTLFEQLAESSANVLLLDVSMPGPGILEVIRRVKSAAPHVRILVVSVHPEQHYARRVIQAHKLREHKRIQQLCQEAGFPDPDLSANLFFLLLEGAFSCVQCTGIKRVGEDLVRLVDRMVANSQQQRQS